MALNGLKIRPGQVTTFISKIGLPKILPLVLFIRFSVDSAMSPIMVNECVRQFNVRIGEHIGILPLTTKKQDKPQNSSVADHLLFCNHSAYYDDISILTGGNKRFQLELKVSQLITRQEHHIGTIVPIRQALVTRSLLQFYLLLVVSTRDVLRQNERTRLVQKNYNQCFFVKC